MFNTKANLYSLLTINKHYQVSALDMGNAQDYDRLSSYIMYLARLAGVQSKRQFSDFYYSQFYNFDWSYEKQLFNGKDLTLYLAPNVIPIDYKHDFKYFDLFNEDQVPVMLTRVHKIAQNSDYTSYEIDSIVKPAEIWQEQYKANNWLVKYAMHYDNQDLYSLSNKRNNSNIRLVFGSKINVSCGNNSKSHIKHLSHRFESANNGTKLRKEYQLKINPKHCTVRNKEELWDIVEVPRSKQGKSWKLHKFKHQYDHNLVYNHKRIFNNYYASKLNRGCYEYYTDYEKYKHDDFADGAWDCEDTGDGELGYSMVSLAVATNIGATY